MKMTLLYTLLGYLSGSVLYIRLYAWLFQTRDASKNSLDGNPGAFNAFKNGGFACGMFVLLGDLLKAFVPVYLYLLAADESVSRYGIALVMWAPVFGHLYPIFYRFQGGKGIAATFGSTLGVWAGMQCPEPALSLAALFLFFKLIVRVRPDLYLTGLVFLLLPFALWAEQIDPYLIYGSILITTSVMARLTLSREPRPELEVSLLWKH